MTSVAPSEPDAVYCYACRRPNTRSAFACAYCANPLELTDASRRLGETYLLNELGALRDRGLLSADATATLRAELLAALGVVAVPAPPPVIAPPTVATDLRPVTHVVPPRPVTPPKPAGPGLLSPERAPSLLLYIGAFLIVVAALIFVGVSGQQIGGEMKVLMLIAGTIAFVVVALACHRSTRVLEAGRTFLVIGALLVPLDFAAYYLLITGTSLAFDVIWTIGWLVSAGLYGVLAASGYGRLYAYLFLPAVLATAAGIDMVAAVPLEWAALPVALVAIAVEYAAALDAGEQLRRLTRPIERAARYIAVAVLAITVLTGPVMTERAPVTAALVVAGAFFAWRTPRAADWERWAAAIAPAAVALSLAFVLRAPAQTYGFVLALAAIAYGAAGDALRVGTPVPTAPWLRAMFERLAILSLLLALAPIESYWRAPYVGALVGITMAMALGAVAVARAAELRDILPALVVGGAAVLHAGVLSLAIASRLIQSGPALLTGLVGREVALVVAPLALALALATAYARRRIPLVMAWIAIAAVGSAAAAVLFSLNDHRLTVALAGLAAAGIVAAAVIDRRPAALWVALAFAATGAFALDLWLIPPIEARPLSIAAVAVALFVPAYLRRWAAQPFARTIREIGLVVAGSAVVVGLASLEDARLPRGVLIVTLPLWSATIPAVVVCGVISLAEGLRRRAEEAIVAATVFFPAAVLMVIASARPEPIEAYTIPIAAYLALVAWGLAHWHARLDRDLGAPAAVAAAVALMAPTYLVSWDRSDVTRGVVVLGEAILLLRFAADRGDGRLAQTSLLALAAVLVRACAAPLDLESASALFGAIAIGLALAVPRFITWRAGTRTLELTELVGALLVVGPPLVRATARGSDALDQGASALFISVLIVALALWSGRRALLAPALGVIAVVGILALPDSARAEPYVAGAAVALALISLLVPLILPRRLPLSHEWALQVTAGALLLSSTTYRTYAGDAGAAVRLIAESLALVTAGIVARREMLSYAGAAGAALSGVWIMGAPDPREFHGIVEGAALVALALLAARFAPRLLDERALLALEGGGAFLFIAPTLISGWASAFFPRTPFVFFEMLVLLAIGTVLHRRWLVAAAVVALGLETLRGLIDTIDRLPNYVLFAASGALLLAVGFVLLLKREAWHAWSTRVLGWWTRI